MKKNSAILDTNIIVRFLTGEPRGQIEKIIPLLSRADTIFQIPDMVVAEAVFVLWHVYQFDKEPIAVKISSLLELPMIQSNKLVLQAALETFKEANISFVDAYLYHQAKKEEVVLYSFDKKLQKMDSKLIKEPS